MARREEELHLADEDPRWYKDAVFYELHIRAFADSNSDGVGDIAGLIDKLDYLQDLGVTAIWLLPFYPSPLKDDGYDISDYVSILPIYGDMPDFRLLVEEAHRRGLRIITELVLNHSGRGGPPREAGGESSMCGATPRADTGKPGSYSGTTSSPTGPGTRSPKPTTGTASILISPISTTIAQRSRERC